MFLQLILHQFLIFHSLWTCVTHSFFAIFFIIGKSTFKEGHLRIAFKCKNMGSNTVEEPAVVGNNNGATGKAIQTFFQCTQGIDCLLYTSDAADEEDSV